MRHPLCRLAPLLVVLAAPIACDSGGTDEPASGVMPEQQGAHRALLRLLPEVRGRADTCNELTFGPGRAWCDDIAERAALLEGVDDAAVVATLTEAHQLCGGFGERAVATCLDLAAADIADGLATPTDLILGCIYAEEAWRLPPEMLGDAARAAGEARYRQVCRHDKNLAIAALVLATDPPGCLQAEYIIGEIAPELAQEADVVAAREQHARLCGPPIGLGTPPSADAPVPLAPSPDTPATTAPGVGQGSGVAALPSPSLTPECQRLIDCTDFWLAVAAASGRDVSDTDNLRRGLAVMALANDPAHCREDLQVVLDMAELVDVEVPPECRQ